MGRFEHTAIHGPAEQPVRVTPLPAKLASLAAPILDLPPSSTAHFSYGAHLHDF
jgi:hypothetical protein